jgi:hypothetical protein
MDVVLHLAAQDDVKLAGNSAFAYGQCSLRIFMSQPFKGVSWCGVLVAFIPAIVLAVSQSPQT